MDNDVAGFVFTFDETNSMREIDANNCVGIQLNQKTLGLFDQIN